MTFQRSHLLSIVGLLALGVLAGASGVRYAQGGPAPKPSAPTKAKKQLYRCPMHPQIVQEQPGKCPICGMNLVPVESISKSTLPACGVQEGGSGGCCGGDGAPTPQPAK